MSKSKPLRILLPPGIGDCHWVLLKLQAFLRGKTDVKPQVWSMCFEPTRKRVAQFLDRIPFIDYQGEHHIVREEIQKAFPEGINEEMRAVIPGLFGFDYYICFNRHLTLGGRMDYTIREGPINWKYEISVTSNDNIEQVQFEKNYGAYALFYFSRFGMLKHWWRHFNDLTLYDFLLTFLELYPGVKPVFIGMEQDRSFYRGELLHLVKEDGLDLVGKTTTSRLLMLIRRARCIIGFHCGPTIIAPHLGTPTLMLWNQGYYKYPGFRWNWVAPEHRGRLYIPQEVEETSRDQILQALVKMEFPEQ